MPQPMAMPFQFDRNVGITDSTVRECVAASARRYLRELQDIDAAQMHAIFVGEVEQALLAEVLRHCEGNLTLSARALGLSRTTLRKKLTEYGIQVDRI